MESDFDSIDPADSKPLKVEIDCVTPPTEEQVENSGEIISRDYNAGEIELTIKRVPSVVGGFNILSETITTTGPLSGAFVSFEIIPVAEKGI